MDNPNSFPSLSETIQPALMHDEEENTALKELYDISFIQPAKEHTLVMGKVLNINKHDVMVNIGTKFDSPILRSEFKDMPELAIGDEVEVYIEIQENKQDQQVLSRKKARLVKAWETIKDALENNIVLEGLVKRRTKGGLIMDIMGIEAFLPGSQIDIRPIQDFDIYLDKKIDVKVLKINNITNNVIVSHKKLIEGDVEKQRTEILNNLEEGQVLEGTVKNMTKFGVFVDLGGIDGLLYITDISWGRVEHPDRVLELGQKIKVVVIGFDEEKKRIALGMKQLTPHPWDSLPDTLTIGSKIYGKIVNITDYGLFIEVQPNVEGLIHISELSWSQHAQKAHKNYAVGDKVNAIVLTLDREERKMSLGIKQLTEDPWKQDKIKEKYAINKKHKGTVINMTNFGAFIELEEGIEGLLHISDISWTKKIKSPFEIFKLKEVIDVIILELNIENKKLALGVKQLEENPWDICEKIFTVGSTYEGNIIKKMDKGAIIELPYGIEGFCIKKNLLKEDGIEPNVGDSLTFQIIEMLKNEKKIIVSHADTFLKKKQEILKPKNEKKIVHNPSSQKSTLGDIESLATLKKQFEEDKNSTKS